MFYSKDLERDMAAKKTTILDLQEKKRRREPITMVTAYDYPSALAVERAGIDSILVGDSLGMVVLGYESTVPVTMDEMLHHCKAVRRGTSTPWLIGDMPFMSYQADLGEAVRNAGRFLKEAGMDAVKLEGGQQVAATVAAINAAGIPVVGHIGFTPQAISKLGGHRVQGRNAMGARRLLDDALALEQAGAVMLVIEMVPDRLAAEVASRTRIPIIGIGAGGGCDGQVLVLHDLLGLFERFTPRFAKRYAELSAEMARALTEYRADVVAKRFPDAEHAFTVDDVTWREWLAALPEAADQELV